MKKLAVLFLFFVVSSCFGQSDKTDMPYTIDLSNTTFKYEGSTMPHFYNYTAGKKNDTLANYFTIVNRPYKKHGLDVRKQVAKELLDMYKGIKQISQLSQKEIVIDNEKAFEICLVNNYSGKAFTQYVVVLGNNKTTLFFAGKALTDFDETVKEFKAIARSIKIK